MIRVDCHILHTLYASEENKLSPAAESAIPKRVRCQRGQRLWAENWTQSGLDLDPSLVTYKLQNLGQISNRSGPSSPHLENSKLYFRE